MQRWERWCRGGGAEMERCVVSGAKVMQRGADAQVLMWRCGDVQSWCRGGEVQVGWQMCRCTEVRGAVVERCRGADVQISRVGQWRGGIGV